MSRTLPIAALLTLALTGCADSTATTASRKTEHADASLGSHVPRSNAAASQDEVNPAVAGERAFAGGAGSTGSGTGPR